MAAMWAIAKDKRTVYWMAVQMVGCLDLMAWRTVVWMVVHLVLHWVLMALSWAGNLAEWIAGS